MKIKCREHDMRVHVLPDTVVHRSGPKGGERCSSPVLLLGTLSLTPEEVRNKKEDK